MGASSEKTMAEERAWRARAKTDKTKTLSGDINVEWSESCLKKPGRTLPRQCVCAAQPTNSKKTTQRIIRPLVATSDVPKIIQKRPAVSMRDERVSSSPALHARMLRTTSITLCFSAGARYRWSATYPRGGRPEAARTRSTANQRVRSCGTRRVGAATRRSLGSHLPGARASQLR